MTKHASLLTRLALFLCIILGLRVMTTAVKHNLINLYVTYYMHIWYCALDFQSTDFFCCSKTSLPMAGHCLWTKEHCFWRPISIKHTTEDTHENKWLLVMQCWSNLCHKKVNRVKAKDLQTCSSFSNLHLSCSYSTVDIASWSVISSLKLLQKKI